MNFVGSCGKPNLNFDPDSGAIASLSHIIGDEPLKYKIHILVGLNHISVFKMRCFRTNSLLGVVHILRNHGWGGGSSQMITVLHRGGPANDYGIT